MFCAWHDRMQLNCGSDLWDRLIAQRPSEVHPRACAHFMATPTTMRRRMLCMEVDTAMTSDMSCSSFSPTVSAVKHEYAIREQFFKLNLSLPPVSVVMLEPIGTADRNSDYLCSTIYQPLTDALFEMIKVKPDDPLEWLANFMLTHNCNKPLVHGTTPQIIQRLMDSKEQEDATKRQKDVDAVPAHCGCYLPFSDRVLSSTAASSTCCCNKTH